MPKPLALTPANFPEAFAVMHDAAKVFVTYPNSAWERKFLEFYAEQNRDQRLLEALRFADLSTSTSTTTQETSHNDHTL